MINTSRGEAEPSTVVIFIDGKQYSKRGNLEWKEELPPPPSPTEPSSEIIGAEFKDHGMENVGLNAMRVLEKIVRSRDKRDPDGKENVQHIKSWIDAAGRLSKQEFTFKRADKRWSRLTIYYEIDPTINIETPIKPKKN